MICYLRVDKQEFSEWAAASLAGKVTIRDGFVPGTCRIGMAKHADIVKFKLRWWDAVTAVKKPARQSQAPKLTKGERDQMKAEHEQVRPYVEFCLAQEPKPWSEIIVMTLACPRRRLSDAERSFLHSAFAWYRDRGSLSPKQAHWVESLALVRAAQEAH